MGNAILKNGLSALEFSRQTTLSFLEDVPDDQLTFQPVPGSNHALWGLSI